MKLAQAVKLKESMDDADGVAHWLTINNHHKTEVTAKPNDDGSVDVTGDIELGGKTYPADFPPIRTVNGNIGIGYTSADSKLPQMVTGDCKLWVGEEVHVKTSVFPKGSGGKASLSDTKGKSTMEVDDITMLNTYSKVFLMVGITSGLNLVAGVNGLEGLKINDSIDGIPSTLNLKTLMIRARNGAALKGMYKKLKTLTVDYLQINIWTPGPLMMLLKPSYNFKQLNLNVEHTLYKSKEMTAFMIALKGRNLDIYEAQEAMIDAGYKDYAGM